MKEPVVIKRCITMFIVPLLLIFASFLLSFYYYREVNINTLQFNHPMQLVQFPNQNQLLKSEVIHGEFVAKEDNLGAIALPVTTFNRINNDIIVFELKEKNLKDWYCINKYFTDRFPDNELYPFGFPPIEHSIGKIYEFKIYSINGVDSNAIGFLQNRSYFVSRYTFSRSVIMQSKSSEVYFVLEKLHNLFFNIKYVEYFSIFLVPFLVYLFFVLYWNTVRKSLSSYLPIPYLLIIFMVIVYVLQPVLMKTDVVIFIALVSYVIARIFHIQSSKFFGLSIFLLLISPLWFLVNYWDIANRSAVVIFFFSITGLLLLPRNIVKHTHKNI